VGDGFDIRLDSTDRTGAGRQWAAPLPPVSRLLQCDGATGVTSLHSPEGVERTWDDPLEALSWMDRSLAAEPRDARWVGYLAYDLGRRFETLPAGAADDLGLPLFSFTFHATDPPPLCRRATPAPQRALPPRWNFTRGQYQAAVRRAINYIAAGDVFQVNLSQRCTLGAREPAAAVYERLSARAPAAYGALLDYGDHALVCNSPELFLRVTRDALGRRRVVTRPIKGTRPRASGMAAQLRESAKDAAELNMIVDLERNDLGRVCEIGSVKVTEPRAVEAHPTVYHGVATVEGALREDVTFVSLLRATFPGGSVTGAPKIRAMQIIDQLEPVRRGPYCGAIGYLASDGTLEFNVAIRTIIMKDGLAQVPVGGGVVADSDPAAEYEETLVKARAMLDALGAGG
jgi:anthranilate/para-aminobenzoate synthase component I